MPVIVDEVIISVEVTNPPGGTVGQTISSPQDKQQVVAECVERVLEILAQKSER
ncbi:MAG: hypothetical protein HUU55_04600 [Myxococcales bacterium]|nr:hypothetical protein [Myxococcales bacterium]